MNYPDEMNNARLRAIVTNLEYAIARIFTADRYAADMESSKELALADATKLIETELTAISRILYKMRNE